MEMERRLDCLFREMRSAHREESKQKRGERGTDEDEKKRETLKAIVIEINVQPRDLRNKENELGQLNRRETKREEVEKRSLHRANSTACQPTFLFLI
jgi:hypothetical protein